MHPLMKHREKRGPHSLEWPQPVISKHVLKFRVLYAIGKKQLVVFWAFWHNVFYSSASEETERLKWQENGCGDFQLGGGGNEMLQSVNARSGESWRRDKNVSIYANCCPDPPPGCHCLLSGEKIKGPSVLNLSRIRLYSAARHSSPFGVTRDSSEVLRGQHTRWCSFEAGSWFCLFKVSMEMPDCAQPTSPPEQRGRSCGVQSASDDWWLWRESAVCCRSSSPSFAGCEWARAGAEDAQDRRISARFERNNSLKMFGAMLLNPPKLTFARVIAKRNVWRQNKPTNLL